MSNLNYLRLQVSIIFFLVATVGATAIVRHPGWFGEVSVESSQQTNQIVANRLRN
jgi:hypothetical protein